MTESTLTQEIIDHGDTENGDRADGLLAKAKQHPILAGGAVLAGAGLAYAAVKAVQGAADNVAREIHVETSILIDKAPPELYEYWRDFQHLPLFMNHLVSVTRTDTHKTRWIAKTFNHSTRFARLRKRS